MQYYNKYLTFSLNEIHLRQDKTCTPALLCKPLTAACNLNYFHPQALVTYNTYQLCNRYVRVVLRDN